MNSWQSDRQSSQTLAFGPAATVRVGLAVLPQKLQRLRARFAFPPVCPASVKAAAASRTHASQM